MIESSLPDSQAAAVFLVQALGPTLVAALSGTRDRKLPEAWTKDSGPEPDSDAAARLNAALSCWNLVAGAEGPDVARAWFIGGNPWLDDDTPVTAIREGWFGETAVAAQAMAEGSFSG